MSNTQTIQRQQRNNNVPRPREGHRFLRHLCITGIMSIALTSIRGILPESFNMLFTNITDIPTESNWYVLLVIFGMFISWIFRKRKQSLWKKLLTLAATAQVGYWIWLTINEGMPPISTIAAIWSGVIICWSFSASSQKSYQLLQSISAILIILGGWQQVTSAYPYLLGGGIILLIISSMAGKLTPVRKADKYVNTTYPGIIHTLVKSMLFIITVAIISMPLRKILPRPTDDQKQVIQLFISSRIKNIKSSKQKKKYSIRTQKEYFASTEKPGLFLSISDPPKFEDKIVFTVQGKKPCPWRTMIYGVYKKGGWTPVKLNSRQNIAKDKSSDFYLISDETGKRVTALKYIEYKFDLLEFAGNNLIHPKNTYMADVPGCRVYANNSNLYVSPGLVPPQSYVLRVASKRYIRPKIKKKRKKISHKIKHNKRQKKLSPVLLSEKRLMPWKRINIKSPKLIQLVQKLTRKTHGDYQKVQKFIQYIRSTCNYKLESFIAPKGTDPNEYLLFEKKEGWCIHFASALAVMCRLSGIPARVITGFGPGTYDPITGTYRVLDSDAHAWVEAYLKDSGWKEFDATPPENSPLAKEEVMIVNTHKKYLSAKKVATNIKHNIIGYIKKVYKKYSDEPDKLIVFFPAAAIIIYGLYRVALGRERERIRHLWNDVRKGTPKASARAAYNMIAEHLEKHGYGSIERTTPGEYFEMLREENHPATRALGAIVSSYQMTAFGPEMSLRWNRKQLEQNCRTVLSKVSRKTLFPWTTRQIWQDVIHPQQAEESVDAKDESEDNI